MQQASDFLAESEALDRILSSLGEEDFRRETGFKAWTFETILRHLHFWNAMAHVSLTAPNDFQEAFKPVMEALKLPDVAEPFASLAFDKDESAPQTKPVAVMFVPPSEMIEPCNVTAVAKTSVAAALETPKGVS